MRHVAKASLPDFSKVDWDAKLDSAFELGRYDRLVRTGDWQVITGMRINLPDALSQLTSRSGNLLILGDTIHVGKTGAPRVDFTGFGAVYMIGRLYAPVEGARFYWVPQNRNQEYSFIIGLLAHAYAPGVDPDWQWRLDSLRDGIRVEDGRQRLQLPDGRWVFYNRGAVEIFGPRPHRGANMDLRGAAFAFDTFPRDVCKLFLYRNLVTAQWLVDSGETELGSELLDRLQEILTLFPETMFPELTLQIAATREAIQPIRQEPDFVPYLSPTVYADLAEKYGPALKAYADTFTNFMNRNFDLQQRQEAARLMLNEKKDTNKFQTLVSTQLEANLALANENIARAAASITSQQTAVKQAKSTFEAGMQAWKDEKQREAAIAIASAAIGFISGIASIFAGNPNGATAAAEAAAKVEKAVGTLEKIVNTLKTLAKIVQVIAKVAETANAIHKAVKQGESAKDLASRMSQLRDAADVADLEGAPSAGAHWDQLWVEFETLLLLPVKEEIGGAADYLKELKILVIYGRAQTTAEAALVALMQEFARATLQAAIAKEQQKSVEGEINRLKAGQHAAIDLVGFLWLRYKTVQRSMIIALQNFDEAHRYWALTDSPIARDANRPMLDIAGDLLEVANIKERQQAAFASFQPPPEDFTKVPYEVSKDLVEEFLKTGQLTLRYTPQNSPMSGWGRIGRVRVDEIFVWVEWLPDQRPEKGLVAFKIRSNGIYSDQRLEHGKMKPFTFVAKPLNSTFRYDLKGYSEKRRDSKIRSHAAVAEKFRMAYSEPTLFTEWHISLFSGGEGQAGSIDLAALVSAISGISLEFSGTLIDDPGLLRKRARLAQ